MSLSLTKDDWSLLQSLRHSKVAPEQLERLHLALTGTTDLATLRTLRFLIELTADPSLIIARGLGGQTDPWQARLLRSDARRVLLNCGRQVGKSTACAGLALRLALLEAPALVLLTAPSLRQSTELYRKVVELCRGLGWPVTRTNPRGNETKLELVNGSRIIALPGNEATIRGYSAATILIVDEASRCPDDLFLGMMPTLATSNGRAVFLSTPCGRRGYFHAAWESAEKWDRVSVPSSLCPRIPAEFLEQQRRELGPRWFAQEYENQFHDSIDQIFSSVDIQNACDDGVQPLEW
jgi:terminase large subunit-like protein